MAMDDSSGDDEDTIEEPAPENLNYKRSLISILKLIVLPPLYFVFIVVGLIVAFFSIQALFLSYHNRVRSVRTVSVNTYDVIGIAFFPNQFATYNSCQFMYADDLSGSDKWKSLQPPGQFCTYTNVSFYSQSLQRNRTAMVFNGPTLVHLKQSLMVYFSVNTSTRDYSAIQYTLLGHWDQVLHRSKQDQQKYLSEQEHLLPLFYVSPGFRTWIKMVFMLWDTKNEHNISSFRIHADMSAYNDRRNLSDRVISPLCAVFEWKGDRFEYVTEILSTTAWNTLGSLAGVFIALIKVGEFTQNWIKRVQREKKKKLLQIAEIDENHRKKIEQYLRKKMEKKLKRLTSSKQQDWPG